MPSKTFTIFDTYEPLELLVRNEDGGVADLAGATASLTLSRIVGQLAADMAPGDTTIVLPPRQAAGLLAGDTVVLRFGAAAEERMLVSAVEIPSGFCDVFRAQAGTAALPHAKGDAVCLLKLLGAECEVEPEDEPGKPKKGLVRYAWGEGDLDRVGEFRADFVLCRDGKRRTLSGFTVEVADSNA